VPGLVILNSAYGREEPVDIPAVGNIVLQRHSLSGFDQVEAAGFFEAEVTPGEDFQVLVEAERALLPYLEIEVRGQRLQVGPKPGINYSFEDASQRVKMTLPALTRVHIGNRSTLHLTDLETEETLRLEAADFSALCGSVEAKEIYRSHFLRELEDHEMPNDHQHGFMTTELDPQLLSTPFGIQTNWHVITGAPSSGKSTLIDQLADRGVPDGSRDWATIH
jgi:hypothetical protein